MGGLTFAPAMDVTHACVRRRFRHSCLACADVCPVQAFLPTPASRLMTAAVLNAVTACSSARWAITGITPRKRFLSGDTLVGPFTDRAPGE